MLLTTYPGPWMVRDSTLAIGTTSTNAGLDMVIDADEGIFQLRAVLPTVNVGGPTNVAAELQFSGTVSSVIGSFTRWAGTTASAVYDNSMPLATSGSVVATMTILTAEFRVTSAGTLQIFMTRTGGTSSTLQAGAYMTMLQIA